ncbi:hypothetical protein [Macrococcus brunensis]|uniref:hypothetical protein n=1 Tax=Macrococcus brunensis TaxID=198483 RepID=UPI001EF05F85|nr:hypothetical protein [Macrococcus brunensis]ULG71282.1 hypothetical protein MGG12_08010 [Macrococcus brunensis]
MDFLKNRIVVRLMATFAVIAIVLCLFFLLVECKTNFEHRIGYSPIVKMNVEPLSKLNVERWVIKR